MESKENLWLKALTALKEDFGPSEYETWIKPASAQYVDDTMLVLSVPNRLYLDWLQTHALSKIESAVARADGGVTRKVTISAPGIKDAAPQVESARDPLGNSGLNPKYTFDNFVIGHCNRFAHVACTTVAENPAKSYNPLFIYGGVGLGKTHLICAIGNALLARDPSLRVVYLTSEKFMGDFVEAIKADKGTEFRTRYRHVDCLIVDDIQFIAGKSGTMEEFFHTFNQLFQTGKQVVLAADQAPGAIPSLEERLASRFQLGLTADIQAPDLETRIAILKKISDATSALVPENVFLLLAESLHTNVRVLEGALNKIIAYSHLMSKPVSVELAEELLKDVLSKNIRKDRVTIERITEKVSDYYGVSGSDLSSRKRSAEIVLPRHLCFYLCRELTPYTTTVIGQHFGGKDHSTVLHGIDRIRKRQARDPEIQAVVQELTHRIKGAQ